MPDPAPLPPIVDSRSVGMAPQIAREGADEQTAYPGYARSAVPRADGAAYEVENPGYAGSAVPRADGAAYEVENPGYASYTISSIQASKTATAVSMTSASAAAKASTKASGFVPLSIAS